MIVAACFDARGFSELCDPQRSNPSDAAEFMSDLYKHLSGWLNAEEPAGLHHDRLRPYSHLPEEILNPTGRIGGFMGLPPVLKFLGDGILAVWECETEDHARKQLRAQLARCLAAIVTWPPNRRPEPTRAGDLLRVGLASGPGVRVAYRAMTLEGDLKAKFEISYVRSKRNDAVSDDPLVRRVGRALRDNLKWIEGIDFAGWPIVLASRIANADELPGRALAVSASGSSLAVAEDFERRMALSEGGRDPVLIRIYGQRSEPVVVWNFGNA